MRLPTINATPASLGSRRRAFRVLAALLFTTVLAPTNGRASVITSTGSHLLTENALESLLARNPKTGRPVDTIEELIPLLPYDFKRNYTFVYESRSPFKESISPAYPRTILFSNDGKTLLTYTGDPTKPGSNLLEAMYFDAAAASFSLKAYLLPAAERSGFRPSKEASNCASCHGADARPIYDSYPLWPGFYGSIKDTFPPGEKATATELANYKSFLSKQAKTGVYKDLHYQNNTSVPPFLDPKYFVPTQREGDLNGFENLPNTRLGMALTELNRQRIYRKLAASPGFKPNRNRLLAGLLNCQPTRMGRSFKASIRDALLRENIERLDRLGIDPSRPHDENIDMQELLFLRESAELAWTAREAGADRSDWSMALEPGSLAFFDGILSGIHGNRSYYLTEDLIFELLRHLAAEDSRFKPAFKYDSVYSFLGYPFGHRIRIGDAKKACGLLHL